MYRNKSLEFQNDESPDMHAGQHDESYDWSGPPDALADIQETVQKHMTKYNIQMRKMIRDTVLDSPLKGKINETCIAECVISIVQTTPRIS